VKGEIVILYAPQDADEPNPNLNLHKQYDVEIIRILNNKPILGGSNKVYSIRYFINDQNNSLDYRKAWIGSNDNFDKAMFQWTNDSTVAVRMFNSITAIADTVELFSFKGGSGIKNKRKIKFQ
jgi:hypothetical protein